MRRNFHEILANFPYVFGWPCRRSGRFPVFFILIDSFNMYLDMRVLFLLMQSIAARDAIEHIQIQTMSAHILCMEDKECMILVLHTRRSNPTKL